MKSRTIAAIMLCISMCCQSLVHAQDMDTELSKLTEDLAKQFQEKGNKKISVFDFTDLDSKTSELGKYVAEQLTVGLVMKKREFSVLDRANRTRILDEHKLTASGLINPDTAKKFGMFAGVDALVLGKIVPMGDKVSITVQIIATETSEITGGAKAKFLQDENVRQLISKTAAEAPATDSNGEPKKEEAKPLIKSFGDLRIELPPLTIVNGRQFVLNIQLTNQNPKKSLWVAVGADLGGIANGVVTDSNGNEFKCESQAVSGIAHTALQHGDFFEATEIKPRDSISATVKFISRESKVPSPGSCRLQLEFLSGNNFNGLYSSGTSHNLGTKIEAN